MNNFVFSQDPLLFKSVIPQMQGEEDLKQQYEVMMRQYQSMSQPNNQTYPNKDYLGELDRMTKEIEPDIVDILTADEDYNRINVELQVMIQEEMLRSVKWKINSNPDAVNKIEKLKEKISIARKEKNDENNRNLMELNDYIKNYSDMTFDEYKQLKNR